jgi:Protein of unknown function (DUF2794)
MASRAVEATPELSSCIMSKAWCNCGKTGEFCTLAKSSMGDHCYTLMTDIKEIGSEPNILRFEKKSQKPVRFDRHELSLILGLYGRYVAEGEWRDYAIDFAKDVATFAIHRRASEQPLYRIQKTPALSQKQGLYCVVAPGGLMMKRGNDLEQVLRVLHKKPKLIDA